MMPREIKNITIKLSDDTIGDFFENVRIYIDDQGIHIYEGTKEYFYNMNFVLSYEIENID